MSLKRSTKETVMVLKWSNMGTIIEVSEGP